MAQNHTLYHIYPRDGDLKVSLALVIANNTINGAKNKYTFIFVIYNYILAK